MRLFSLATLLLAVTLLGVLSHTAIVAVSAKKPSHPSSSSRRPGPSRGSSGATGSRRPPLSKRRYNEDDLEDDEMEYNGPSDEDDEEENVEIDVELDLQNDDDEEEEMEEVPRLKPRKTTSSGRGRSSLPSKKKVPQSRKNNSSRSSSSRYYDEEDDYDRPPRRQKKSGLPPRGRGPPPGRRGRGNVVPYTRKTPTSFTRGLEVLRSSIPDPGSVKDAAIRSLSVARETTTTLSANLYREVKGLTSSELEQVMLKATRPDDTPVKGKHAERLVGVTYQISGRFDIYDAVLRKLWAKMAEKDWRTTIKALYILHRFSADGSPEHAAALKVLIEKKLVLRLPCFFCL
jgi:hypothetical protein